MTTPDPELEHLNLIQESKDQEVNRILSNSSGFGGANVSVIFEKILTRLKPMHELINAIKGRRTVKPATYSDRKPDASLILS